MVSVQRLIDNGARIYGVCGKSGDIYPALLGKRVAFGFSMASRGVFNYVFTIKEIHNGPVTMDIKIQSELNNRLVNQEIVRSYDAVDNLWIIEE